MKPLIDIILPCYRPPESWARVVVDSMDILQAAYPDMPLHLILVNDGSPEGVEDSDIAYIRQHRPKFRYVVHEANQGKGQAVRSGLAHSNAPYCLFTDIDFPYTLESMQYIMSAVFLGETDIAIGIKDDEYYQHLPPFRTRISKGLRWLARTFLQISITDTQCGLKGFNARGREVFLQTTIKRYLADLEFILLAERNKALTMKAIPIRLKPGVSFSSVNPRILMREGINFLKVFIRSSFRR